ncbi:hypothetical protein ISS37_00260 [candidate division KSB1 bacterium]|nr:hypothetical protein [candidate division KSB1 bacterium]
MGGGQGAGLLAPFQKGNVFAQLEASLLAFFQKGRVTVDEVLEEIRKQAQEKING